MKEKLSCPACSGANIVKNGHTHYGKQNHRCKDCGRQFVERSTARLYTFEEIAERLFVERVSLRGVARVLGRSFCKVYEHFKTTVLPLGEEFETVKASDFQSLEDVEVKVEADELWTFVGQREEGSLWVWLAQERRSRLIVGFALGDRSELTGRIMWESIPRWLRQKATFFTDKWEAYANFIPPEKHMTDDNQTNHIERFNCTLRQRISRLVRKTLAFSKDLVNLECHIRFFIHQYNLSLL